MREMVKCWLKQVDPQPTWTDLAQAIKYINPKLSTRILKMSNGHLSI